jgi:release factor glutamine methyltransferase
LTARGASGKTALTSVDETLRAARRQLSTSPSARLDAELLLGHVLRRERSWLLGHGHESITPEHLLQFRALVERRAASEPVAYLRGFVEWFGLDLRVTPAVLIPRPETELLAEAAIAYASKEKLRTIAEIGTGSGAISIALASRLPSVEIVASEVDPEALRVAADNLRRQGLSDRVRLVTGSLLDPFDRAPDLLVANLPYLSDEMLRDASPEVRREPRLALVGGGSGLTIYEELLEQIRVRGWKVPALFEIDPRQTAELREIVRRVLPKSTLSIQQDYASLDRIALIET